MYETMIGRYTTKYEDMGDVKRMFSWVEMYALAPRKRSVTWANLVFNPNLTIWVFSSGSGMYFEQKNVTDNTGIRRIIYQGRAFLAYDAEHEYNVKYGMDVVAQLYGIKNIMREKHYLPLIERIIELEFEENKPRDERSEAKIMELKSEIREITKR